MEKTDLYWKTKLNPEEFKILREKNLVSQVGFKDLGAGGVACASVELAETSGFGSEIWMEKIHIGLRNLHLSLIHI